MYWLEMTGGKPDKYLAEIVQSFHPAIKKIWGIVHKEIFTVR